MAGGSHAAPDGLCLILNCGKLVPTETSQCDRIFVQDESISPVSGLYQPMAGHRPS